VVQKLRTALRLLTQDPNQFAARLRSRFRPKQIELEESVAFLLAEVSELRSAVRHLRSGPEFRLPSIDQTYDSFDYQWRELNESVALLSSDAFRAEAPELVCELTRQEPGWFSGRRVLDAGCGSGRFSWALAKLGAQVTAFDQSAGATEQTQTACKEFEGRVHVFTHSVLEPLPPMEPFDLVWSFGVLHHTGDTYHGLQSLLPLVRPGGVLFLMLYGEPRPGQADDYRALADYMRLRRLTLNRSYEEKLAILKHEKPGGDLHGWFDAVSPAINDTYSFDEIRGWLTAAGFEQIERTADQINHNVIARRKA